MVRTSCFAAAVEWDDRIPKVGRPSGEAIRPPRTLHPMDGMGRGEGNSPLPLGGRRRRSERGSRDADIAATERHGASLGGPDKRILS